MADKLRELGSEGTLGDKFTQASPRFLAWLVTNQQWTHLAGFPAFSTRPDDGSCEVLWLGQKGSGDVDVPLAPIKAWPEDLQQYADLFPWRYILADAFFPVMPAVDGWQILSEKGYVRTDVVVKSDKALGDFLPDEPLPEGEHKTVDAVAVTDVILLARDRVGIMARVRDSQSRARLFWRFLTEWLVKRDPEGLEVKAVLCQVSATVAQPPTVSSRPGLQGYAKYETATDMTQHTPSPLEGVSKIALADVYCRVEEQDEVAE